MSEPSVHGRRVDADVQRASAAGDVSAEAPVSRRGAGQHPAEHPQTPEAAGLEGLAIARREEVIVVAE